MTCDCNFYKPDVPTEGMMSLTPCTLLWETDPDEYGRFDVVFQEEDGAIWAASADMESHSLFFQPTKLYRKGSGCPDCGDTGYVMQDIGTATVPDYVEIRCRCNPEPTDADASNWTEDWADWDNVPGSAYDDFHATTYLYGTE